VNHARYRLVESFYLEGIGGVVAGIVRALHGTCIIGVQRRAPDRVRVIVEVIDDEVGESQDRISD
jgi:hypothetical protein